MLNHLAQRSDMRIAYMTTLSHESHNGLDFMTWENMRVYGHGFLMSRCLSLLDDLLEVVAFLSFRSRLPDLTNRIMRQVLLNGDRVQFGAEPFRKINSNGKSFIGPL